MTQRKLPAHQVDILLVLAAGPNHGYAIMKQAQVLRGSPKPMGVAQLYTGLQALLEDGLVAEVPSDDPRRRVYEITRAGRTIRAGFLASQQAFLERARHLATSPA